MKRRADDLMNMFAGNFRDLAQGSRWITEIQSGVEGVTNPKAAEALGEARVDITALLAKSLKASGKHKEKASTSRRKKKAA